MITNIYLLIVLILTVSAGLLAILHQAKVVSLKKNSYKIILYFVLVVGIIYIALALFGRPILNKISAYQDGVLMESEEKCKSEKAPFWCNL